MPKRQKIPIVQQTSAIEKSTTLLTDAYDTLALQHQNMASCTLLE